MKIYYYRGKHPNFGDELNQWIWPKLIPNFFDNDSNTIFIGIGSVLSLSHDHSAKKIVFGSGLVTHYGNKIPNISEKEWDVFFVRGPRTAKFLNIPPEKGVGDSAILIRTLVKSASQPQPFVSFIPHWESLDSGHWQEACRLAGIHLIDPRQPVQKVIDQLLVSRLVIAEAMHGAIVADALRIPWVPVLPLNHLHREKWLDWSEALGITLRPYRLWPSCLGEVNERFPHRASISGVARNLLGTPLHGFLDQAFHEIAAQRLIVLSRKDPCLSEEEKMNDATNKMVDFIEKFTKKYRSF
ncbi:glycosyltransferase family protein [Pararhodospirillum oryzae]|uniref:Succinoglycan biosynthesis protein exov n=1 Tax=Pararhodospirillum oryzae TaxID=478448 RepID=A0A512H3V5_9PROT|nr:hypothetical protein [Pararhodospirillum oryzae]GEO80145.1 succinoglycan biosynthesis protein exov [Pararhodospirillum oryzae]